MSARNNLTLAFDVCGGVELQHGRNVGHVFAPHFHDEYQILVMIDGDLRLSAGGAEHAVAPPAICAINPGEVHAGRSEGWGWECRNFYVPAAFAREIAGDSPRFAAPIIHDAALARRLVRAHRLAIAVRGSLAADEALVDALGALFQKHARASDEDSPAAGSIGAATEYLRAHFAEPVRVKTLAQHASLSLYHFLRVFSRATGLTPHAFQNQLRLAHAKKRLAEGAPAAIAAAEAGYYDQSHLIRALRRSHGLTPAMIARAAERNFVQ